MTTPWDAARVASRRPLEKTRAMHPTSVGEHPRHHGRVPFTLGVGLTACRGGCGYHVCACPKPTVTGFDPDQPGSEFTTIQTIAGDIRVVTDSTVPRDQIEFRSSTGELLRSTRVGVTVNADAKRIAEDVRKAMAEQRGTLTDQGSGSISASHDPTGDALLQYANASSAGNAPLSATNPFQEALDAHNKLVDGYLAKHLDLAPAENQGEQGSRGGADAHQRMRGGGLWRSLAKSYMAKVAAQESNTDFVGRTSCMFCWDSGCGHCR